MAAIAGKKQQNNDRSNIVSSILCMVGVIAFCAGCNSIYAKALRLMVPDGSHLLGLNEETVGDIFESFLGIAWQNRRESFRRNDVASSALEDFVYALYKVERAGLDYLV